MSPSLDDLIAMGHVALDGSWPDEGVELANKRDFIKSWTNQVCGALEEDGYDSLSGLIAGEGSLARTFFLWDSEGDYLKKIFYSRLQILDSFLKKIEAKGGKIAKVENLKVRDSSMTKDVFIVHGHDVATQQSVARFIQHVGLNPVVLSEQPNQGRTIIEKFEEHANVAFAVVLLTPDDLVGDKRRARQNVIFEMGYFAGKHGRHHVAVLVADEVDIPSDLHGVAYIPLNSGEGWKVALAKELRRAGLPVDAERILS